MSIIKLVIMFVPGVKFPKYSTFSNYCTKCIFYLSDEAFPSHRLAICGLIPNTVTSNSYMGLDARKPVFGVSDNVGLKPVSSDTETSKKINISLEAS